MSIAEPRCAGCGNCIDEEDLFCSNCGREAPASSNAPAGEIEEGFIGFDCETCGASLTYDSRAEGLRCAFCGSVTLKRQTQATGRIKAESYVPFEVSREQALQAFGAWVKKGFFRPFGFQAGARVAEMNAVFIPCWSFQGDSYTYFTGDSSRTPAFARAEWCPVFGEHTSAMADVLVPASGSLSAAETMAIAPYDFSRRRPYQREELREYVVEDFGLGRRGARPLAHRLMVEAERAKAASRIEGKSRNVHVSTLFSNLRSAPVLLPVWLSAYRFKERTYRFLINGQTGELIGNAPFSYGKLALCIAIGVVVAGIFAILAAS